MEHKLQKVTDKDGNESEAHVFYCRACGMEPFIVYQIVGQDHSHLQCLNCGTAYCPPGSYCSLAAQ